MREEVKGGLVEVVMGGEVGELRRGELGSGK